MQVRQVNLPVRVGQEAVFQDTGPVRFRNNLVERKAGFWHEQNRIRVQQSRQREFQRSRTPIGNNHLVGMDLNDSAPGMKGSDRLTGWQRSQCIHVRGGRCMLLLSSSRLQRVHDGSNCCGAWWQQGVARGRGITELMLLLLLLLLRIQKMTNV